MALAEELKNLRDLVVAAKEIGLKGVSALVRKMLEKNVFLLGFLDINEGAVAETVDQLTELQNARVRVAYEQYVFQLCSCLSLAFTNWYVYLVLISNSLSFLSALTDYFLIPKFKTLSTWTW